MASKPTSDIVVLLRITYLQTHIVCLDSLSTKSLCFSVSLFLCFYFSLFLCFYVSLSLCLSVSLSLCIPFFNRKIANAISFCDELRDAKKCFISNLEVNQSLAFFRHPFKHVHYFSKNGILDIYKGTFFCEACC